MKSIIYGFKKFIRFFVSIFASREFAFIYCLIGTLGQVAHTYYLTLNISSFVGNFKTIQAGLISFFISSSLLYFVAIADKSNEEEYKKIHLAINIFMIIEILINFYYYSRHLLIDAEVKEMYDFIFAVLVSCLLPVTIKLYANSIKAKEWIDEMSINEKNVNTDVEVKKDFNINDIVSEEVVIKAIEDIFVGKEEKLIALLKGNEDNTDKIITEYMEKNVREELDINISKIFTKNKELFLKQFENKCKVIMDQMKTKQ